MLICLFGTTLQRKADIFFRALATLGLIAGLALANHYICCSGEQGAVGVLFIGLPLMITLLLIYTLLCLVQYIIKTRHNTARDAQNEHR